MIAYKVVNKKTRKSCTTLIREETEYTLEYLKGKIVEGIPDTLGVICFGKKYQAKAFLNSTFSTVKDRAMILRVKTIGHKEIPKLISGWLSSMELFDFYSSERKGATIPPEGTVCYSKVEVLD